ncbi:hypothetical protein [Burkholderia gladioli]|uniref:hypothetical protein n=1 Tax=Burkholderia gladioli TaxID=28095 RepID=UPI000F528084|nr:hypothetical protein [Burkholderia gladioli]
MSQFEIGQSRAKFILKRNALRCPRCPGRALSLGVGSISLLVVPELRFVPLAPRKKFGRVGLSETGHRHNRAARDVIRGFDVERGQSRGFRGAYAGYLGATDQESIQVRRLLASFSRVGHVRKRSRQLAIHRSVLVDPHFQVGAKVQRVDARQRRMSYARMWRLLGRFSQIEEKRTTKQTVVAGSFLNGRRYSGRADFFPIFQPPPVRRSNPCWISAADISILGRASSILPAKERNASCTASERRANSTRCGPLGPRTAESQF